MYVVKTLDKKLNYTPTYYSFCTEAFFMFTGGLNLQIPSIYVRAVTALNNTLFSRAVPSSLLEYSSYPSPKLDSCFWTRVPPSESHSILPAFKLALFNMLLLKDLHFSVHNTKLYIYRKCTFLNRGQTSNVQCKP